jgi:ABC-type antimicrobial peptide transport system permease subunit
MFQFGVKSDWKGIVLAAGGVLFGIALGLAGSTMAARAVATPAAWDFGVPLFAIVVSVATSAGACVIPAILAARMEPSAALRP